MSDVQSLEEIVESLAHSFGFEAHYKFTIGDEVFCITYKEFLSTEIQRRLDEVEISLEDCDKDDDGEYLLPLRRHGQALVDSRDALRLMAIWGPEKYRRFEQAGGSPDLLTVVWLRQDTDLELSRKGVGHPAPSSDS